MDKLIINGITYLSNELLSWSDYGGSGSVGLANIRYLQALFSESTHEIPCRLEESRGQHVPRLPEDCEGLEQYALLTESYCDGMTVWVRGDAADEHEIFEALENYPALDDELVSQVEMEWEQEAWVSWLRSDLLATLPDDTEEIDEEYGESERSLYDQADSMEESDLQECYNTAMEATNTYPEPEYSGVAIDVKRIAKAFEAAVREKLTALAKDAWIKERIETERTQAALFPINGTSHAAV